MAGQPNEHLTQYWALPFPKSQHALICISMLLSTLTLFLSLPASRLSFSTAYISPTAAVLTLMHHFTLFGIVSFYPSPANRCKKTGVPRTPLISPLLIKFANLASLLILAMTWIAGSVIVIYAIHLLGFKDLDVGWVIADALVCTVQSSIVTTLAILCIRDRARSATCPDNDEGKEKA